MTKHITLKDTFATGTFDYYNHVFVVDGQLWYGSPLKQEAILLVDPEYIKHEGEVRANGFLFHLAGNPYGGLAPGDGTLVFYLDPAYLGNGLSFVVSEDPTDSPVMRIVEGAVLPGDDVTQDLGSSTKTWSKIYVGQVKLDGPDQAIEFSNNDRITFTDSDNTYYFGADGGVDNATVRVGSLIQTSDVNTKTKIKKAPSGALETMLQLEVKEYVASDGIKKKGVIAQETPDSMRRVPEEGHEGVDIYAYIAELHQALQELNEKVDNLMREK